MLPRRSATGMPSEHEQRNALAIRAGRCPAVSAREFGSRRQNVGIPADSAVSYAGAHDRKSPGAGKLLEAAAGVEPAMEVLQSSVDRAQG